LQFNLCPFSVSSPCLRVSVVSNYPARTAFTLIELLIVVAIIALLVGILLPALGRSRAAAQQTLCASTIRQLVLATALYAHDHDDHAPPGASQIQTHNLHRWHGSRASISHPFTPGGAPITPYLDDSVATSVAARTCPTFKPALDALTAAHQGFERACGGYAYNNAYLGMDRVQKSHGIWTVRTDRVGARTSRFAAPTSTTAFTDAAFAADTLIEYSFAEPPFWPQYPTARTDPSIHFRHTARATVAWLDAHVTTESMTRTHSSGLYTADPRDHAIGWYGPDDNSLFDYE